MTSLDIGILVSIGMVSMVVLGMRVAFAAGLGGLVWIFWSKKAYDPDAFV